MFCFICDPTLIRLGFGLTYTDLYGLYGSTAWSTTAKTKQQVLDNVRNQALRITTGSMRSTPVKAMEKTAAVQPLSQRRDAQIMVHAEKLKSLPNHPMKERMNGLTKNRLKRSSFILESKGLARERRGDLPQATFPLSPADLPQPWKGKHTILPINTTVPLIAP